MVKKNSEQKLRRDFYKFQKKVDRLEEVKHELNSLDTSGFENEVDVIKARLRDVTAIPEIEKMMSSLRKKILKRKDVKKKSPLKEIHSHVEDVSEDVNKIVDTNAQLKHEIKELRSEIDKRFSKPVTIDPELEIDVENQLHGFVRSMKGDLADRMRRRETQLREQMNHELQLRKINLDRGYKEMIEKLRKTYQNHEQILNEKERKLKEDYEFKLEDIKTRLQNEVNAKFATELRKKFQIEKAKSDTIILEQQRLNAILKEKLAKLEKQKQTAHDLIEKQKHKNIDLITKLTKEKNNEFIKGEEERHNLLRRHHEDIQNLTKKLGKNYSEKFDAELKKSINAEREKLTRVFEIEKQKMRDRLANVSFMRRQEIKNNLRQKYEEELKKVIEKRKKELRTKLENQFNSHTNELLQVQKMNFENKLAQLEKNSKKKEAMFKMKEKKLLEEQKSKNLELAAEKRNFLSKFNLFKGKEDLKIKEERIKAQKQVASKMHDEMVTELKKREELMKEKLKQQFEDKIKNIENLQKENLAKKKKELARELQKRARSLVG